MPDVNVVVGAYRTDSPQHEQAKIWLESAIDGLEPLGLTDAVATGYVRVVTHPRVFAKPTPLALAHVGDLQAGGAVRVTPGRTHCRFSINCVSRRTLGEAW